MAVNLASLVVRVQAVLSDLPDNYCTDEQIYIDLKTARSYIDSVKRSDFSDDTFEEEALVRLGSYFTYVNYTSLAERQLGTLPQTTDIKLVALRRLALAFVRQMSAFPIADDLSIDDSKEEKSYPVTMACLPSVFGD